MLVFLLFQLFVSQSLKASEADFEAINPVLLELHQLNEAQDAERARLIEIVNALPILNHAQSQEYAVKLAESFGSILQKFEMASDPTIRAELAARAHEVLEVVLLITEHLDPNDNLEERMSSHIKSIEKARLPAKILLVAAGAINAFASLVKSKTLDLESLDDEGPGEFTLEPYEVSEEQWKEIQAKEFIDLFLRKLGPRAKGIHLEPGIYGALKSHEYLSLFIDLRKCQVLLEDGLPHM